MNRNRFNRGVMIFAAFMILLLSGLVLFKKWNSGLTQIHGREPLSRLGYCSSMQTKPCITSFSLDPGDRMIINVLTISSFPDFYLKIKQDTIENLYECHEVKELSTSVACVGKPMPPGEVLQFLLLSIEGDTPLAEGQFPMIGLALATPEIYSTPTYTPLLPHRR